MRSVNAPAMSAGVMTANIIWKAMNSSAGMWGANGLGAPPTPDSRTWSNPPMTPPWSVPKASEYPTTAQRIPMTPTATSDWAMVATTFFSPTSPP